MIYRLLGGVGLLALALVAIWLYGNSQKNAGRLQERVEWHKQMQAFERRAAEIIVERVKETRKIEHVRAEMSNKVGYDAQKRIAALSAALRLRASGQSNSGRYGGYLSYDSVATLDPTGTSQEADMVACGEAVIKAEGWQAYYQGIAQ